MSTALRAARRAAVDQTLFAPTSLAAAVARLGFVQADPIRAPARAEDLILRHRVAGFKVGDLERGYPALPLVEDMLHVYGFLHRSHRALLHPRRVFRIFQVEEEHPHLRRGILDYLAAHGASHPRTIERALALDDRRAGMPAGDGRSSPVAQMLDVLHYRGLLHVARREDGVRIYGLVERDQAIAPDDEAGADDRKRLTPQQRADGLIEFLTGLYAPLPAASLKQLTGMLGERTIARDALRARIPVLQHRGILRSFRVDGLEYLRTAIDAPGTRDRWTAPSVRFLAPFDPLVWDRRRFQHLWGWRYRFEAHVAPEKRRLGYYAMPLLWDTLTDAQVIGWVNVACPDGKRFAVEDGYATKRPTGAAYRAAFDAEVARLAAFLARDAESSGASRPRPS